MSYLDSIIAAHRHRATQDTRSTQDLTAQCDQLEAPRGFAEAIAGTNTEGRLAVIAEIKRGSPSKGAFELGPGFGDAHSWASTYADAGATAISVLTDQDHFFAKSDDLNLASTVGTPCLRKDFTVSTHDVLDARLMGASAILLIAAALEASELTELRKVAADVGLDCLFEIHSLPEMDKLDNCEPKIVGVNQRNLDTFEVDTQRALSISNSLDPSLIKVAESGIETPDQAATLAQGGFSAILVGGSIVTSPNPSQLLSGFADIEL